MKIKSLKPLWPYFLIFIVTSIYFIYILNDSRYFFVDDFTGFTFSVPRTYFQIITDSLASRSVDRHKFIGYLITKWLYHHAGTEISHYFLTQFIIHTANCFLVFKLLKRITKETIPSLFLSLVYAYRFYLSWFSNIHMMTEGLFLFIFLHLWLNYLEKKRHFYLPLIITTYFLAIFTYGPAFLFVPALIPVTLYFKGKNISHYLKILTPFIIFIPLYFVVFTFTPDSLTRFQETTNPYRGDFSLTGFLKVHSIYLSALSGGLLPQKISVMLASWIAISSFALSRHHLFLWIAAFFISIAANSFFPQHTMFYYLYPPIIFLLILFGFLLKEKQWPLVLAVFLIVFNPFHEIRKVAFRLIHPSANFEEKAMLLITHNIEKALKTGEKEIQLSNWEVTPNLQHAIDYQAIPLFLSHPNKDDFLYSYSRDTQVLTLTPKKI